MKLIITAGAIILDKTNKKILLVRRPSDKGLFPELERIEIAFNYKEVIDYFFIQLTHD